MSSPRYHSVFDKEELKRMKQANQTIEAISRTYENLANSSNSSNSSDDLSEEDLKLLATPAFTQQPVSRKSSPNPSPKPPSTTFNHDDISEEDLALLDASVFDFTKPITRRQNHRITFSPATQARMNQLKHRLIIRRVGQKLIRKLLAKKFAPGAHFDAFMRIQVARSLIYHLSTQWPQNLIKSLQHIQYLPKNSASDCLCLLGKIHISKSVSRSFEHHSTMQSLIHEYFEKEPYHVFVKIVAAYPEPALKFKEIEPILYEKVVNKMVIDRLSPHFMMYLVQGSSPLLKELPQTHHLWTRLRNTFPQAPTDTLFHTLVLETSPTTTTLHGFLERMTDLLARNDVKGYCEHLSRLLLILFQLFYSLAVMDEQQITHYDLHFDNIFVSEPASDDSRHPDAAIYLLSPDLGFIVNDTVAHIRIFDWDSGYEVQSANQLNAPDSRNKVICPKWGICDTHKPEFDLHKVIEILSQYPCLPELLVRILQRVYLHPKDPDPNMNPLMRTEDKCRGQVCKPHILCNIVVREDGEQVCQGEFQHSHVMKSVAKFFNEYTIFLEDADELLKKSVWKMFTRYHKPTGHESQIPPIKMYVKTHQLLAHETDGTMYFDPNYLPHEVQTKHQELTFSQMKNLWSNKVFGLNTEVRQQVYEMLKHFDLQPVRFHCPM